jgi:hypothetical protein
MYMLTSHNLYILQNIILYTVNKYNLICQLKNLTIFPSLKWNKTKQKISIWKHKWTFIMHRLLLVLRAER